MTKKQDLIYSWGMPIIGLPISGFLFFFGWIALNIDSAITIAMGMLIFITGIIGLGVSILMFKDVINGKISPMFIKN